MARERFPERRGLVDVKHHVSVDAVRAWFTVVGSVPAWHFGTGSKDLFAPAVVDSQFD